MLQKLKKTFSADIYIVFGYRILILYFLYFLSRVLFYLYNADHFNNMTFGRLFSIFSGAVQFDTSAIIYTNLLFILGYVIPFKFRLNTGYQKVLNYIFFVCNGIALFANFADIPYFDFVLERTTINIFKQFRHETNLLSLFIKFLIGYWYIALLYILTICLMIYLYNRAKITEPVYKRPIFYYPVSVVMFFLVAILCIGGVRGGFLHSTRPITLSNAGQYVKAPAEMAIVLNTPFCLIRSTESESFDRVSFFNSERELEKIYTPVHYPDTLSQSKKDNVVIFILESCNKEFIGCLNKNIDGGNYKGYMPFLDSLIRYSRTYTHSYANGHKSIDALPSVLTSIPAIEYPFILTPYYSNTLNSLPGLLKEKGYKTAFFHGAPNGSMGFQAFSQLIGIDEYYGKNEYKNDKDFDGIWGIWDEEFLQYFANTLDTFTKPFVATLFTVTSHHPFILPKKFDGKFKMRDFPLQRCIEYTDYSLKRFFETASKMPWFKNTLFVFTADHVSINQRPEFKNDVGYFSVPIIFYKPESSLMGIDSITIAQQIDIMPTVLSYLGFNKQYIAFGQNLFKPDSTMFAINYLNGTYRLFKDDYLMYFDGKNTVHLYNISTDPYLTHDMVNQLPEVQDKMETLVKAFIQQYKNRMIDKRLIIKE
jgi:phosphoglycerol transferase MdoB-like AlkP superfamily enzyme